MPARADRIDLRPLARLDEARLREWLRDGAATALMGGSGNAQALIRTADQFESSIRRGVIADERLIGYAQAIDASADHAVSEAVPAGTWLCDVIIGDEDFRGEHAWSLALGSLVADVMSTTLANACATLLPVASEAHVRAAERIGFRWTKIMTRHAAAPFWVLLRERSSGA